MQMIDVLKRLAELDSANPNRPESKVEPVQNVSTTISESEEVAECGMMPEMGDMGRPSMPASINMSAGSGEELGDLIKAIATLAGTAKGHSDVEPMSTPSAPAVAMDPSAGMNMRSVIDKLNPDMDDSDDDKERKTDETVDSMPADPNDKNEFDANQHAHRENQPGQGDRMDGTAPKAFATAEALEKQLFQEYQAFLKE